MDPVRVLLTRRERHQYHLARPRAAGRTAQRGGLIEDEATLSSLRLALEPGALPALGAHDPHRFRGLGIEPSHDAFDAGLQFGIGHRRLRARRVRWVRSVPP